MVSLVTPVLRRAFEKVCQKKWKVNIGIGYGNDKISIK